MQICLRLNSIGVCDVTWLQSPEMSSSLPSSAVGPTAGPHFAACSTVTLLGSRPPHLLMIHPAQNHVALPADDYSHAKSLDTRSAMKLFVGQVRPHSLVVVATSSRVSWCKS